MPGAVAAAAIFVGEALFDVGAPLFLVNAAIAATPFVLNTAASIGLSLAANALLRPASAQQASVTPSAGQQAIRQAVPPRWKSFGTVRLAGPVWWFDTDGVPASALSDLYIGIALNHGRIDSFVSYHIDEVEVTIDGSGNVLTAPYSTTTTKILTRLGLPTETAYSQIAATSIFNVDDVRGDGVASMLGVFRNFVDPTTQQQDYPNGYPRFRATINASVVWDPRDAAQSRTDATTWEWSENPVVCLLNYLLDPDGYAIPYARISGNIAEWKAAADICDEQVLSINAGGYEKRYRLALTYLFTDRPADVVSRFLSTCDGRCWQKRDGTVGITVGRFVQPTVTLADRDIIEHEITLGQDPLTAVAGVRARYMSPDNDYREQDADPWPDGGTVLELGEDRVVSLDLTAVPSHSQTRRLMKRQALREAAEWRGTIRTTLAGLRAMDLRYVNLVISELGISGTFEVGKFQLEMTPPFNCTMEVLSVGSEIDDWDPATEEGTPASTPIDVAWDAPAFSGTTGDLSGYSIRQILAGASVIASGDQVRLTFKGPTGATLRVAHASIVRRSGSSADGTTTPTPVTFAGASGFSVFGGLSGFGGTITSDWITFPLTSGADYLVVIDVTSGAGRTTSTGDGWYSLSGAATWNVAAGTGMTLSTSSDIILDMVETRGSG